MEVIYKDKGQGKLNLPKNVKQIGTEQNNRRIYIEDYAYSFIKDITIDEDEDGAVGILLGEVQESDGVTYVFIKGVVEVLNAAVYTDKIAFTQETWPITKKYINYYFGEYDILGWYLSSSKITDKDMEIINMAHSESFTESDNVFFMVNGESGDEAFFENGENGLSPMTGYTVYYEKNAAMQRYIKENRSEFEARYQQKATPQPVIAESTEPKSGKYREIVKDKTAKEGSNVKRNLTVIYALSMLVVIVVLIIGVNQINSYDKISKNNKDTQQEANGSAGEVSSSKTPVTSLEGNVSSSTPAETEPNSEDQSSEQASSEEPTTEEPTTEEPTTAEPEYETYTVKEGDGMWRICVTFYGAYSAETANKVLAFNGLADANSLQPGMTLKIPTIE